MTIPILSFTNGCCGKMAGITAENQNKIALGTMASDALLSISALVIGILGATSIIAMPAAAAYTLIGISGGITLLWIAFMIKRVTCEEKQLTCFVPKQKYTEVYY